MLSAPPCETLLGDSPAAKRLRAQVADAAARDCPVLLEGERGTGRELVARVLHAASARRGAGFVRIDNEFFERQRVQEKLRRAVGGTLLVKEVAQMGKAPQRQLLDLLRQAEDSTAPAERKPDGTVRILASSGVDLAVAVRAGLFDEETYQRLGGTRIMLPTLRSRPDDVPALAEHFLQTLLTELNREPLAFSSRAMDKLRAYSWPGNVAELKDVVRRMVLRARDSTIELADVEAALPPLQEAVPLEQISFEDMVRSKLRALLQRMEGYPIRDLYEEIMARVERPLLEEVLLRTNGNQIKAAEMLGLNRNTLRKKLQGHEVQVVRKRR